MTLIKLHVSTITYKISNTDNRQTLNVLFIKKKVINQNRIRRYYTVPYSIFTEYRNFCIRLILILCKTNWKINISLTLKYWNKLM